MRIQLAKEIRHLRIENNVQWPGELVFKTFSEGIMVPEYARIRILTLRVRWKSSRVGQIWSPIELLTFLEIWDAPWRVSMATIFVAGSSVV